MGKYRPRQKRAGRQVRARVANSEANIENNISETTQNVTQQVGAAPGNSRGQIDSLPRHDEHTDIGTEGARATLAARREQDRQGAAAAAAAQEVVPSGYEEGQLVAHGSAWASGAWVEPRGQLRPVRGARGAGSHGQLPALVCVECSEYIGAELYTNCNRCGEPVHAACGHRGQDPYGPTQELYCSECLQRLEELLWAERVQGEVASQRRSGMASQALSTTAGVVASSAFVVGAAVGATAATAVRAAGAVSRGIVAGVELARPRQEETAEIPAGTEHAALPPMPEEGSREEQARVLLAARVPQGLRMRSAMRRGVATACRRGHEGPLDSRRKEGGRARSRLDVVDVPRAQCGGRRCFHRGLDTKLIVVGLARKHVEVRTSGSTTSRGFVQRALHEEGIRVLRESETAVGFQVEAVEVHRRLEEVHRRLEDSESVVDRTMALVAEECSGSAGRTNIRVKAEVEWPKYDATDIYYDVEGYPAQEKLEMLRGGLSGVPLLDFKTFVDDNELRNATLERGTDSAREDLWQEVEAYLKRSFHRPLLERQRRARAEYNACSMRNGEIREYMAFQTDNKRCLKNLERSGLAKAREEVKVDFIEKLTEECATHLMLTPYTDARTGNVGLVRDLEAAMEMARSFFAVQDTKRVVFAAEEIEVNREARFGGRLGQPSHGFRSNPQGAGFNTDRLIGDILISRLRRPAQQLVEERYAFDELEDEAALPTEEIPFPADDAPSGPPEAQLAVSPPLRRFADIANIRPRPRPEPGRNHKLWISFGGVRVKGCKDTGAAATTIPESLVMRIIRQHADTDPGSKDYPIGELMEYRPPIRLIGFASAEPVDIKYGCVLYTTFHDYRGSSKTVPIEYRVVPDERDGGGYPLLGARTVGPEGLHIDTTLEHHVVRKLGLTCARAELGRPCGREEVAEEQRGVQHVFRATEDVYVPAGEERVAKDAPLHIEPGAPVARLAPCLSASALAQREHDFRSAFRAADPTVIEHLVRLSAVLETAANGGLSFKLSKCQLLQPELRLLGTITGREGQKPDPAKVQGIMDFPPPTTKGQLGEFFGSVNWLRPFLSTAFSRESAGLRRYLKKEVDDNYGALDEEGMASFRMIQKLVAEFIALCVPDYAAAADWERTGRCFEIVLDASLLGGGAALFQLDAELGKPRPLAMCSRSFTTAQQECGEKVIRWWGIILQSGVIVCFLAGKVNPSDGLSRNPRDRDALLARRAWLLKNPSELAADFKQTEFEDTLTLQQLADARWSLFRSPWELEEVEAGEVFVATGGGGFRNILKVLAVPSWEAVEPGTFAKEVERLLVAARSEEADLFAPLVVEADAPMVDEEGLGFWFRQPRGPDSASSRKELRRSLFTAVLELLRQMRRRPPHVVVALGQGAVVAAFACHPAVRELVYRHRFVQPFESEAMESAAKGVAQWFFVHAAAVLRAGLMSRLFDLVPEMTPLPDVWSEHQVQRGASSRSDARCLAARFPNGAVLECGGGRRDFAALKVRGLGRLAGPLRPYVVTAQELDPVCSKMLWYLSWETEKVVKPSVDLRAHGLTQEDAARLRREAARFCIGEDGALLRRLTPELPGDPAAVPVLPAGALIPEVERDPHRDRAVKTTWRNWAMLAAHAGEYGGHAKLEEALVKLRATAWWSSMSNDLARFIERCPTCASDRRPGRLALTRSEHPRTPFDTVQIDLQGPWCPGSKEGWRYVFTLICVFTRYPTLRSQNTKSKTDTARTFSSIIWELGTFPRVVQSDRGREFVNDLMQEVLVLLRMRPYTTPAYTPRINGIVERSHQQMATTLRLLVHELAKSSPQLWGEFLACLQYHLRHHRVADSQDEWLRSMVVGWKAITSRFKAYLDDYEVKAAMARDRKARWQVFRAGDMVMLERPPRVGDPSKGLLEAMEGPYRIIRMIGEHRAVLAELDSETLVPRAPAGEHGIATSRLTLVPAAVCRPLRLDEDSPSAEAPLLREDARRRWSKATPGVLLLAEGSDGAFLGEVRVSYPRRLLVSLARFGMRADGTWARLYLRADGVETFDPTLTEVRADVPYVDLRAEARLSDSRLDARSRRAAEALHLTFRPHAAPAAEEPPARPEDIAAASPTLEDTFPEVPNVFIDGSRRSVVPKAMDADELRRIKTDEIVFDTAARSTARYAEIIAFEAWQLARANPHISDEDRAALVWVCVEWREALWIEGASFTRVSGAAYDVDVAGAAPISQQPYRKSPAEAAKCEAHISKNLAMGLLTRHVGAWSTPAFVVPQASKPNGRLVCDYRRVNAVTRRMYYPIPRVDDTLRRCAGRRWLSSLDAVSGFNHLPLTPRAREILAICTFSGLYAWESLPFGPCDGPQAFQAVMRRVFDGYAADWLAIYIDDLCIASGAA
ncbi:unnamed protein product [Prorocentrum cordatum]|uniref:Integrase catalytic domain-containing protein n=1 Tax=Prorocentrum cordatum TaxID=2364126 RepID=A0ABN9TAP2_9DINO|nr:unnamed protein product [Polarella glacialis]